MFSFLGVNKMQGGGTVEQAIPLNVRDKIVSEIQAQKLSHSLTPLKAKGRCKVEYDYTLCTNENFKDNIFVISTILHYNDIDLENTEYGVYTFDLKGDKCSWDEKNEYGTFFRDMIIIQSIK